MNNKENELESSLEEDNKKEESKLESALKQDFGESTWSAAMEQFKPYIEKYTAPTLKDLYNYLGNDEKMITIRNTEKGAFLVLVDISNIDRSNGKFDLGEAEIINACEVEQFIELVVNGNLEQFFSEDD